MVSNASCTTNICLLGIEAGLMTMIIAAYTITLTMLAKMNDKHVQIQTQHQDINDVSKVEYKIYNVFNTSAWIV